MSAIAPGSRVSFSESLGLRPEAQFDLATKIDEKVSRDHDTVKQICDLRSELADLRQRVWAMMRR